MFQTLVNAFKIKEIRRKIWITLGFLLLYRIGCFIPVPGMGSSGYDFSDMTFLNLMSAVSGSALQQGTLFAMGIGPYINSSIIIQLLTVAIPALERLSKQGEEGRKKIAQYTRYLTIILAVIQATGIVLNFKSSLDTNTVALFGNAAWILYVVMIVIYTAGSTLTMWIGERITEYGVGNGISLLIFIGILSTAGTQIMAQFALIFGGNWNSAWSLAFFLVAVVLIFGLMTTIELSERKIPVQYAKQIKGRKMYGGQSTNIPIKVNSGGVLPLIFAFSIMSFPDLIMSLFWPNSSALTWWQTYMGSGTWSYMLVLAILILFFAFFYSQIQFDPEDVAKNIQQNGGFIPGIRPGKPTSDHIAKINNRIVLFGAIYLAFVALVPTLIFKAIDTGLVNVFSTTGLLIIVSVALELNTQLESQIMMKNYKGFLK